MFTLNCKGRLLSVEKPLVMGIINVTPDSFYEDSRHSDINEILQQAEKMLKEGADLIDIGGQSTRPGSTPVTENEETDRVCGIIESLHFNFPETVISVDTYFSGVAKQAVESGASIVNDISGGTMDKNMLHEVAKLKVPYVCMHIKGTPASMQEFATYEDVTREVLDYFVQKLEDCRRAGIVDVIIDPGFGFAKNSDHNFTLLRNLQTFKMLGVPILCGLSRKSTIYRALHVTAKEALNGTTVVNTVALLNGASILRVHDVREAREAVELVSLMTTSGIHPV